MENKTLIDLSYKDYEDVADLFDEQIISVSELVKKLNEYACKIEELEYDVKYYKHRIREIKQDVEDNYKRKTVEEDYDYNPTRDFI